jgi:hypothetical protein
MKLATVESPKGVAPLGPHGTVRESLPSYGSSCLITKVRIRVQRTNLGCTNFSAQISRGVQHTFSATTALEASL